MSELLFKKHRYNLLYGYYGMLLTEKQQASFEYYYFQDLSLAEIASELGVSRTAVYDTIKTVENILDDLESKLELLKKQEDLEQLLDDYSSKVDHVGLELIKKIKEME